MIKVEDMMTRNPHTLLRSHSLSDAQDMMSALDIRHIPIVDTERVLLGIVTQRDILAAQESSLLNNPSQLSYTADTALHEIMHTKVMTVIPEAGLKESAKHMQKHKVGCLPVVEERQLVGIITDSDFVSIAINLLELQEETDTETESF